MFTSASLRLTLPVLLLASLLMILSARATKRLVMKTSICPVCHRERKQCTCRWL